MGWVYFGILAWGTAILLVPLKSWKRYWPIGIFSMITVYMIDTTLASLNAFHFYYPLIAVGALPIAYWLAYFPGGILFAYYRPKKETYSIAYILLTSFLLLAAELIFMYFGYFQHIHWNAANSFMLNIIGFTLIFWFNEYWESTRIAKS